MSFDLYDFIGCTGFGVRTFVETHVLFQHALSGYLFCWICGACCNLRGWSLGLPSFFAFGGGKKRVEIFGCGYAGRVREADLFGV